MRRKIEKRRKPKVADFISEDENIVNNFIYSKGYVFTIIHTKFSPDDKLEKDDSLSYKKRYVPWKDKHLLQNVVKVTPTRFEDKKTQVKEERGENIRQNQGRERAAKKRELNYYAEDIDENQLFDEAERMKTEYKDETKHSTKETKKKADSEKEWEVQEIMGKRRSSNGVIQYHVLWKGWPLESATWEPKSNLTNCARTLQNFEKRLSLSEKRSNILSRGQKGKISWKREAATE
ncbi:Oidioi.mRNA.OKI2018_I69.XSR.g13777.t1.cds [Oikopleura dioica]|uniref:Oidioi.mRNA.OKI2018_I69.XSR.g13777.t1.cds n=1 Tax=Oikopleura dioica TaxID=34765 RepID=A0ABN7SBM5_OIKDI|nr:Oidioi.mRNA.OKI2018_I69.XSR.g13777.t1.cds [Oikopleura dioica]